jgi:hypothetical protein
MDLHTEFYRDSTGYGWFRVLGFGLHWKPRQAPKLFSERYGYERFLTIGARRYALLTPWL